MSSTSAQPTVIVSWRVIARGLLAGLILFAVTSDSFARAGSRAGTVVSVNADLVLVLNGKKVFPIGFTTGPPPDAKTPEGKNGMRELAEAGGMFMRTGSTGGRNWDEQTIAREKKWMDAAARNGMYCWPFLHELASVGPQDAKREAMLRDVINRFKNHPGLLVWKGADEPEWGKLPLSPLLRGREIIRELDSNHPMVTIHAPRGTVESLRPYNAVADIVGTDIYPLGYPPGKHSLLTNKTLSLVGEPYRYAYEVFVANSDGHAVAKEILDEEFARECANNLRMIEAAIQLWALKEEKSTTAWPDKENILPYLKDTRFPKCPSGGFYVLQQVKDPPLCMSGGTGHNRRSY